CPPARGRLVRELRGLPQQCQHLCRLGLEGPAQPLHVFPLHRGGRAGTAHPGAAPTEAAARVVHPPAFGVVRQPEELRLRLGLPAHDAAPHRHVASPPPVDVLRRHHAQDAAPSSTSSSEAASAGSAAGSWLLGALLNSASNALCVRSACAWSARREAAACIAASRSETDSDGCRSVL